MITVACDKQDVRGKQVAITYWNDILWALTICTEISVKIFRQMVPVFFLHRKQERDWVVPVTKYRQIVRFLSTWSLDWLYKQMVQNISVVSEKTGKKVNIPRKVLLFFRKMSTGMNYYIWIFPGIPGFPYKW